MIKLLRQGFTRFAIDTRLRIAFGVLVALTMLISAIAFFTERTVSAQITRTSDVALAIDSETSDINDGITGVLLEVNEFLVSVPIGFALFKRAVRRCRQAPLLRDLLYFPCS